MCGGADGGPGHVCLSCDGAPSGAGAAQFLTLPRTAFEWRLCWHKHRPDWWHFHADLLSCIAQAPVQHWCYAFQKSKGSAALQIRNIINKRKQVGDKQDHSHSPHNHFHTSFLDRTPLTSLTLRKIAAHQITASDLNTFTNTFLINMRMKFVKLFLLKKSADSDMNGQVM